MIILIKGSLKILFAMNNIAQIYSLLNANSDFIQGINSKFIQRGAFLFKNKFKISRKYNEFVFGQKARINIIVHLLSLVIIAEFFMRW